MRAPGFTLIELVVVMVVLGILASVGMSVDWSAAIWNSRIEAQQSRVRLLIEQARDSSIRTRLLHRISFDTTNNIVSLDTEDAAANAWVLAESYPLENINTITTDFVSDDLIVFSVDGVPYGGQANRQPNIAQYTKLTIISTIGFDSSIGDDWTVKVYPLTGFVEL